MRIDLIVVTPKRNKSKIISIVVIVVLLIILLSVVTINYANNPENVQEQINNEVIDETPNIANKSKRIHELITHRIPKYNDEIKEKIKNIYNQGEKKAYLTFDDGPSNNVTPLILDLLKQENIKANFFVLGSRVDFYPDIVKRAYEEGHFIANHGYSHVYRNIYVSKEAVLDEYTRTEESIRKAIGVEQYSSHIFRFPGGSQGGTYSKVKSEAVTFLEENNVSYIDWNCLTNDSYGSHTKDAIMESLVNTSQNKNNLVILMHDAGDKILTYETLSDVIKYLKDNGYSFSCFYDLMNV